MPLKHSTKIGTYPQAPHLIFSKRPNQKESVEPITLPLGYPEIKTKVEPTALTAEYVADDQPIHECDVISVGRFGAKQSSVHRTVGHRAAHGFESPK